MVVRIGPYDQMLPGVPNPAQVWCHPFHFSCSHSALLVRKDMQNDHVYVLHLSAY